MRGVSIRLLEAYPDHAGLLSLQALTEALSSGGSELSSVTALKRHLLLQSRNIYAVTGMLTILLPLF